MDDLSSRALLDTVVVPEYLKGVDIGATQTEAIGCRPAQKDSRLASHCKIAVYQLTWLGWEYQRRRRCAETAWCCWAWSSMHSTSDVCAACS